MELKKEIKLDNRDSKCFSKEEHSYHYHLPGLSDTLRLHEKPVFARMSHIDMAAIACELTFSMYYGPGKSFIPNEEVKEFAISYGSYESLAEIVCEKANNMVKSETCSISVSDHGDHQCDGAEKSSFLELMYLEDKFVMKIPTNHICVLTCNVARIMGFENAILQSYSVAERKEENNESLVANCKKPIKLEGVNRGKCKKFFSSSERWCHFVFDDLILPSIQVNGFNYHLMATYDMEKKILVNDAFLQPLKRVNGYVGNQLLFSLLDGEFRPYSYAGEAVKLSFSFVLQFLSSI